MSQWTRWWRISPSSTWGTLLYLYHLSILQACQQCASIVEAQSYEPSFTNRNLPLRLLEPKNYMPHTRNQRLLPSVPAQPRLRKKIDHGKAAVKKPWLGLDHNQCPLQIIIHTLIVSSALMIDYWDGVRQRKVCRSHHHWVSHQVSRLHFAVDGKQLFSEHVEPDFTLYVTECPGILGTLSALPRLILADMKKAAQPGAKKAPKAKA